MNENTSAQTADVRDMPRAAGTGDRPALRPDDHGAPDMADALWNVKDVAQYLRVPTSSIYKMTARNAAVRIPHIHIGGMLRFRRSDVDRWLTLLTTSNLDVLARMRGRATKVTHGHDP